MRSVYFDSKFDLLVIFGGLCVDLNYQLLNCCKCCVLLKCE